MTRLHLLGLDTLEVGRISIKTYLIFIFKIITGLVDLRSTYICSIKRSRRKLHITLCAAHDVGQKPKLSKSSFKRLILEAYFLHLSV